MNDVDIFIPAADTPERAEFLTIVERLQREENLTISVFRRDEQPDAFQQCDHVRDMIDVQGEDILPITLIGSEIMGIYTYPTEEKLRRLATVQADAPRTATSPSATLAMFNELKPDAPAIGARPNLMGADTGDDPAE